MAAHYDLTGPQIAEAIGALDYVFLAVSSAGTIAGVSRYLKERKPGVKIIAVDAAGSAIFGQTPRRRCIPGLGSAIVPPLLSEARIDDVVVVPESQTIQACHDLLQCHGLFAGGSTGAVYAGVQQYFAGRPMVAKPRVMFLCNDHGSAYLDTIFNPQWKPASSAIE